jgi:transcriptional regulator with XRE-family HTH domain
MDVSQAVVCRILELCKERQLSINALSHAAGVTQSTVNDIVNGSTHNTGIMTISKICGGLGITLRHFFDTEVFEELELNFD